MNRSVPTICLYLVAVALLSSGCATAPSSPTAAVSDEQLRNTDNDLLFATEFPVANKGDALLRAEEARQAGNIDKALFFYVKAVKFDPQDADLLAAIGRLHQYQGNSQLAVRAYTLALDIDPDYARVLEARGLILLAHEEDERALADLGRAVERDPLAWRAHNGLGLLADRSDDHARAILHYDAALELQPESGDILNNRGYSKMLAGDIEGAETDLQKASHLLGHRQAWVNLGTLFARQGRYQLAVEALQEVLPEPEAFNKVAEASVQNGDYAIARDLLEQAIRVSPIYFPAAEENLAELEARNEAT
jgi:Flp pilus assembly protein TadD